MKNVVVTRRSVLLGILGVGAGALLPTIPRIPLVPLSPTRDEWVYDPPTGVWFNHGASARVLRAAQRKAHIRVTKRPWPKSVLTDHRLTDWGRAKISGQAREWGVAISGSSRDFASYENWCIRQTAMILQKAGTRVWYEPLHVRANFRSSDRVYFAVYGISA